MIFDFLNCVGRIVLALIVVYKLTQFREMMIPLERIGLSMMGAGSFLTVSVIWEGARSPFDGWSTTLLTVGAVLFLVGRTWRDRRHSRANARQVAQARDYLAGRGSR
jgi:hypothetical protein